MPQAFSLPDMSCGHCVAHIREVVQALDPQAQVEVDLPHKTVNLESALPRAQWVAALTEAGYPPAGVTA